MDSDDLMHPERLETLLQAAVRDRADLVADDLFQFELDCSMPSQRLLHGKWRRSPFWVDIIDFVRLNHFYGPGPALGYLKPIIRTSILKERIDVYDETLRLAEDYNLVLRLLYSGKQMRVYPFALYYYRKHRSSISHRLNKGALDAVKAADLRFLATISQEDEQLACVIAERIKSIEIALAYDVLLTALKAGNMSEAFAIALTTPRAAALLRLPIAVRLRHLIPLHRKLHPRRQVFSTNHKPNFARTNEIFTMRPDA
jgi:succinoglycan biosynthesis protein ExoO